MPDPNFFVIGAPKAGTTSLCHYLAQHPEVFITTPKEPHFFCDDRLYERGYAWYQRYYDGSEDHTARGEGTPTYAAPRVHPTLIDRILKDVPAPRFVYMVRHPIERMESFYSQEVHNGTKLPPFYVSVRERPYYLDCSRYHEFYSRLVDRVAADRIMVLFFEDFVANTEAVVERVFRFLGVQASHACGDLAARNSRDKHLEDTPAMAWIRRAPGFRFIARHRERLLPQAFRSRLKGALRRPPQVAPVWDTESQRWAIDQLAADSREFLSLMGKPADYWGDLTRPVG